MFTFKADNLGGDLMVTNTNSTHEFQLKSDFQITGLQGILMPLTLGIVWISFQKIKFFFFDAN